MAIAFITNFLARFFKKKPIEKTFCPDCKKFFPGIVLSQDPNYGFISRKCDNLFHEDLIISLDKLYYEDNLTNKE